jgi:hypothetical protein
MSIVTVGHHPELTAEAAREVFQRHFADKYKVYKRFAWDIVVEKSPWAGAGVKLKQETGKTKFDVVRCLPSVLRGCLLVFFGLMTLGLLYFLFVWLFVRPRQKAMEEEVKSFIESAEEFK